uniref:Apple domain-containing protein n=1 Tax=Acrobeloides nanus TaxID=290746 RepID=A0A914D884_9BILA
MVTIGQDQKHVIQHTITLAYYIQYIISFLVCASDRISGYVDQSGINREHWMRIGVKADSLHECARRCYEYIFCYSITFDITQKRPCIFYLHAATHCQGKQLTPIDKLNQDGPVTIECMKCMSDEEVVTLGLTTTTPLTTKKSEETPKIEFSHDEEAKQHKGHAQSSIDNPKLVLTPKDELTNKDIEDALKSKSIPATLGPGRGCVVTFQVDTQTSPDSLSTTETATVIKFDLYPPSYHRTKKI